jgi:hypothetical protein
MWRFTGEGAKHCDGLTRRSFVQSGLLGLGGMQLVDWLRFNADGAVQPERRDASVILFWLSGGPGHMETWDPKPDAPREFRGPFGATATSVPGIHFGELMPKQASIAEHLAVLRTVNHGSGDHTKGNHWMLTGFEGPAFNAPDNRQQRRPAMGSVVSRVKGSNQAGIPTYLGVPHLRGGTDNLFHYSAYLGGGHNPFVLNADPNTTDYQVRNLKLPESLPLERLEDRRSLLKSLDTSRRQLDPLMQDMDEHMQNALELLAGAKAREAFDISAEKELVRDAYGRHTFGQSALLARRMVERGATFVTVNCVPWDHHGSANRLPTEEGAKQLIPPLDVAIAALVQDLRDRGLFEKTLVVAMGEFGRTPRINQFAGRDHWGRTFSVMMAGGGMRMGQAIGRSSDRGEDVVQRPLDPQDVVATIYHHLGIDGSRVTFHDRLDRPLRAIEDGAPIRELL